MIAQFLILGIYKRTNDDSGDIVYDVYADGEVVRTCKRMGTALITLASEIDKKIGKPS